jgi:predicted dithiol-disulfide oxidoreductase (DUF899 family)
MFAPDVDGWPSAGCPGCSMVVDNIGHLAHLRARDTSLALVSRAPLANLESYKQRMGWTVPWFSSAGADFNDDFGVTTAEGENFGLSVFLREGDSVFHTYFTTARGVEVLDGNFTLLDMTPFGRLEEWEDSPAGWPQTPPYEWCAATTSIEEAGSPSFSRNIATKSVIPQPVTQAARQRRSQCRCCGGSCQESPSC